MCYLERIVEIRQKRKLSQYDMAEKLKILQPQYQRYEKGKNEIPLRYFIEICKILNVSSDYILGLKDEE